MKHDIEFHPIPFDEKLSESIPPSIRQHIVLTKDRTLLVSSSKKSSLELLSLVNTLTRKAVIKGVHYVEDHEMTKIISDMKSEVSHAAQDHTNVQETVLDIIKKCIELRASDFHVEVKNEETRVYYRVNGDLDPESKPRIRENKTWGMELMRCIYQSMTDTSSAQFSTEQPLDASFKRDILPSSLFGVRIATVPIFSGHYMVCRLLYKGETETTLEDLGFIKKQITAIEYMMRIPYGIILLGGVTGSGKTTTISCCLDGVIRSNNGEINVITVEDPVEFIIRGARQITVTAEDASARADAYARAIKTIMRLDPDVCMISELRDKPTVEQAIQLALTGHQVWSTVHAIDTTSVLPRLEMMGVSKEILADNKLITGIVTQSLVKKLCPGCKQPLDEAVKSKAISSNYATTLGRASINSQHVNIKGAGCRECGHTGYQGRSVIAEVIIPDAKYMDQYRNGDRMGMRHHAFQVQKWVSRHGHARIKIEEGIVDPRDVEKQIGPLAQDTIEADHIITFDEMHLVGD